jgi:hypothetical protein
MAAAIKTSTKCRQRADFCFERARLAEKSGNMEKAARERAEGERMLGLQKFYIREERAGRMTKAETERRIKAGKLPPPVDPVDPAFDAPPTEADFYRFGGGSRSWRDIGK